MEDVFFAVEISGISEGVSGKLREASTASAACQYRWNDGVYSTERR